MSTGRRMSRAGRSPGPPRGRRGRLLPAGLLRRARCRPGGLLLLAGGLGEPGSAGAPLPNGPPLGKPAPAPAAGAAAAATPPASPAVPLPPLPAPHSTTSPAALAGGVSQPLDNP